MLTPEKAVAFEWLVVRAQMDSEQAAEKLIEKVNELDSVSEDEISSISGVTAMHQSTNTKSGTPRSVVSDHSGDALGTLQFLTTLKNLSPDSVNRAQIFDLFCQLLDCFTVRDHQNFCASKLGRYHTELERCIDRSVASSDLPQASQDGHHATEVQEIENKYKVQPGTVGVLGLTQRIDGSWWVVKLATCVCPSCLSFYLRRS